MYHWLNCPEPPDSPPEYDDDALLEARHTEVAAVLPCECGNTVGESVSIEDRTDETVAVCPCGRILASWGIWD